MRRLFSRVLVMMMALLLSGCGYNELQRLDEQVAASWSQVLNQYERRAELVPKLVASVDAYKVHERNVLEQVTAARARVGQVSLQAGDLDDPAMLQRFEQAQDALSGSLSRLLAVSERYPDLKSDGLFRDLMTQLEGTENRIAVARERYVTAVQAWNQAIRQFPELIVARVLGYQPKPQYGLDKADRVQRDPEVRFDQPATPQ